MGVIEKDLSCPSFSLISRMSCLFSLPFFFFFFCAFLQRPILVNGGGESSLSPPPPPLAQIPRDLYHSSDKLLMEVSALVRRHPDTLTMETMKAGNKGYAAEILVITYNRLKKPKNDTTKFRILLSFGQHGRELITSELALHLVHVITGELKISGRTMISLDNMLDNLVIKVVPMENFNGRKLVEAGDLCERRNGRGVDLNRNWSVDWGKKEKDYDPYEENPGAAPFSEPEAQIMRKVTQSFDPHIWVTVHSGMEALFMPYDHKNGTPDGFSSQLMKSVLVDLNRHHFHGRCTVGSGGGTVGYFAHGTTTDYMYDVAKVPISLTFEIYGDNSASANDCFKMFNPIDTSTYKRVLNEWCAALLELLERGPDQLKKAHFGRMISIGGNIVDGSLVGESREIRKMVDALELGMQELRAYFRLFLLSSVLLMFMFCSRIRMSKYIQTNSSISS